MYVEAKRIINGKKYDTDTAKCVGEHMNSEAGIYEYVLQSLYKKKTGEFFLCGWGEFLGTEVTPLTLDEAKDWMERYSTADEYEAIFGEVEE